MKTTYEKQNQTKTQITQIHGSFNTQYIASEATL